MEILNKNQRRSAFWRLLALGILVLGVVTVIVANTHRNYAGQGQDELVKCQREKRDKVAELTGINTDLRNQVRQLNEELDKCRNKSGEEDPRIQELNLKLTAEKERFEFQKLELTSIEKELTRCKQDLAAAKAF
jgi:peptidoglycan hydrolase CwlO-like protein